MTNNSKLTETRSFVISMFCIGVLWVAFTQYASESNAQTGKTGNSLLIRFVQKQIANCAVDVDAAKTAITGAILAMEKDDNVTAKNEMQKAEEALTNLQGKIDGFLEKDDSKENK